MVKFHAYELNEVFKHDKIWYLTLFVFISYGRFRDKNGTKWEKEGPKFNKSLNIFKNFDFSNLIILLHLIG